MRRESRFRLHATSVLIGLLLGAVLLLPLGILLPRGWWWPTTLSVVPGAVIAVVLLRTTRHRARLDRSAGWLIDVIDLV